MTERHFLNLKDESSLASVDPVEENQFSSSCMMEQLIPFKVKEEPNQKSRPHDGHKD